MERSVSFLGSSKIKNNLEYSKMVNFLRRQCFGDQVQSIQRSSDEFLSTLQKFLHEIHYVEDSAKQSEEIHRVFVWFTTNRNLLCQTSCSVKRTAPQVRLHQSSTQEQIIPKISQNTLKVNYCGPTPGGRGGATLPSTPACAVTEMSIQTDSFSVGNIRSCDFQDTVLRASSHLAMEVEMETYKRKSDLQSYYHFRATPGKAMNEPVPHEEDRERLAGTLSDQEDRGRLAGMLSDQEDRERLAGTLSDQEDQGRLAGTLSDQDDQERLAGTLSDQEDQGRLAGTLSDQEDRERLAGTGRYAGVDESLLRTCKLTLVDTQAQLSHRQTASRIPKKLSPFVAGFKSERYRGYRSEQVAYPPYSDVT